MDKHLFTIRRGEIDREIDQLRARIDALAMERGEIDIAERVVDRLTGASRDTIGPTDAAEPPAATGSTAASRLTVRQMITEALMDARQRGLPGFKPKDIRTYIQAVHGIEIGQQINTTASRMLHDLKEIQKNDEGFFYLPFKEKPADDSSGRDTPAGLSDQPNEHSREAMQGGGT